MSEPYLIVHPDDLNLADVKAKAAELGITAVGDKYVPRGQMILWNRDTSPIDLTAERAS
jgi:hypothetical protein